MNMNIPLASVDFSVFLTIDGLVSLLTLALLEVVLGIDNVIFISIFAGKLPEHQQRNARNLGLGLALGVRIGLLFAISWIISLEKNLFTVMGDASDPHNPWGFSGRDIILFSGGLFLLYKSVTEIRHKVEGVEEDLNAPKKQMTFGTAIFQIILLDIVFSLDSILTAVGLVDNVAVMIVAVLMAVGTMLVFAGAISDFVNRHPTIKMLALSFLLMIGVLLVLEAFDKHVEKGYVYFSMAFALAVELLNMRMRRKGGKKTGFHPLPVNADDADGLGGIN